MSCIFAEAAAGSVHFDAPLQKDSRHGLLRYNQRPTNWGDVAAWLERTRTAEVYSARPVRLRDLMEQKDVGLAAWVKTHRELQPVDVDMGESGMALLLLWEVGHGRLFPRHGGAGRATILLEFMKRVLRRIQQDPELSRWLVPCYQQRSLTPGHPTSRHNQWS